MNESQIKGNRGHYGWRNRIKLLKLAYRNLFRNKRRSFFALLIAVSGCTALCIAIGYYRFSIYSLQELTIRNGFGGAGGSAHVQIMDRRMLEEQEDHALEFGMDSIERLETLISQDKEVAYVLPRIEFGGLISNGETSLPFKGYGIRVPEEMRLLAGMSEINPRLKLGEQLAPLNTNRQGIILGKGLAKALHAKTGDMLMMYGTNTEGAINGIDVELLGIMSTGVSETDRYYLLTRNENAEKLLNSHKTSILALMFKNREHLEDKIRRLRSFLETDSAGAKTVLLPWYQNAAFYLSIRDIFNIIFSFMGAIILVIVLLSCWNIMNMTTMERIREIGTLRAMGLSRRQINSIFVLEAFLIGLFGAIIGMALQWILARIITALHIIMPPVPGMSRPYTLQVYGMTLLHPLVASGIIAAITLSGLSSMMIIKRYTIVESLDHS